MICLSTNALAPAAAIAIGGLLFCWLILWRASRAAQRDWVFRRAPRLPIESLAVHDDAWIEGRIHAAEPVTCPHFDITCAHFRFSIERKVRRTRRNPRGGSRTETRWVTEHSESGTAITELVSDAGSITLDLENADHIDCETQGEQSMGRRFVAQLLPLDTARTVLGVKRDDGIFGKYRGVPLRLDRRPHAELLLASGRGEGRRRITALIIQAVALIAAVAVYVSRQAPHERTTALLLAAPVAFFVAAAVWTVVTHNRFVRDQQRLRAAWRQIDVDLSVRNALLPNYRQVVSGYAAHETALQQKLSELRGQIETDDAATSGPAHSASPSFEDARTPAREQLRSAAATSATLGDLFILVEQHPDLKADSLFADLHRRLWALEEKLAAARTLYNDAAKRWNDLVEGFPSAAVARATGRETAELFSAQRS